MRWRRGSNEHHRSAPLRRHPLAGHHREGDDRLRAQQGHVQGRRHATKPQIKEAVEKLFDVKVKASTRYVRKGKVKAFKGTSGQQSDVKRAIVTLEEGHRIDVTTGL